MDLTQVQLQVVLDAVFTGLVSLEKGHPFVQGITNVVKNAVDANMDAIWAIVSAKLAAK